MKKWVGMLSGMARGEGWQLGRDSWCLHTIHAITVLSAQCSTPSQTSAPHNAPHHPRHHSAAQTPLSSYHQTNLIPIVGGGKAKKLYNVLNWKRQKVHWSWFWSPSPNGPSCIETGLEGGSEIIKRGCRDATLHLVKPQYKETVKKVTLCPFDDPPPPNQAKRAHLLSEKRA